MVQQLQALSVAGLGLTGMTPKKPPCTHVHVCYMQIWKAVYPWLRKILDKV